MRILELHAGGAEAGSVLEFHPNLTIVSGLSAAGREAVTRAAVTAVPAGDDPGLTGLVEAHGVLFDLNTDTSIFGLDSSLDVLVGPDDLPGRNGRSAGTPPASAAASPTAQASAAADAAVGRARTELEDAREAYKVLEDAHDRAERQAEMAADTRQKIMAALDSARRERDQATTRLENLDAGGSSSGADPHRDAELREQMGELEAARERSPARSPSSRSTIPGPSRC
ncbi:MAG: hypothetical protein U5R31_13890 [Acidimicrobiia bacterium]|nr:hypothetical protein [Acidimicrobiia bacterium]